jgi:hypothetical protein
MQQAPQLPLSGTLGQLSEPEAADAVSVSPKREFRCEDAVWVPATVKAAAAGETMSAVLRRLLCDWLAEVER